MNLTVLSLQTGDIMQALNGDMGRWIGRQPGTGESVMAVSHKFDLGGENTYVIRYLTSLEDVNSKLLNMGLLAVRRWCWSACYSVDHQYWYGKFHCTSN